VKKLHRLRRKHRQPRQDQRLRLHLQRSHHRRRVMISAARSSQRPLSTSDNNDLKQLRSSIDEHTLPTLVREAPRLAPMHNRQRSDDWPMGDGGHGIACHQEHS